MKKWIVFWLVSFCVICFDANIHAAEMQKKETKSNKKKDKKEDKDEDKKSAKPTLSRYEKLFKGKQHKEVKGDILTLHLVSGKLYFEMPLKVLGREFLLASTTTETTDNSVATNGFKTKSPMHIRFSLRDSMIYMRTVNTKISYDESDTRIKSVVEQNFSDPNIEAYKVMAFNKDSSAVVFDITALFTDDRLSPISSGSFPIAIKGTIDKAMASIYDLKTFVDNVSIKSALTYKVSAKSAMGSTLYIDKPVSLKVTRTLMLMPEQAARPRISDSRIGVFLVNKQEISDKEDKLKTISYSTRWQLVPKDMETFKKGELVEPKKPIIFYVDTLFPPKWVKSIKAGVLRWNMAFEKIGFKNVMQVYDFPKDDPDFDADNLKYSCIRYVPSTIANAMGPSWVDPRSGEILNASVLVYNDIIKMLTSWRFVQTAQIDERVRSKNLPDDVLDETLTYVIAHEVGHCLGLMHNMAGSAAYSTESLRSAEFTKEYGTTASIMDYARFNYVAQPTDKGVKLTPPDLGLYDLYAIKWLYSYLPETKSTEEDAKILETWVDEKAGDPIYRYGKQQTASRYDPSALEEDLGEDPIKASDYGVKNLKYILSNLNNWIKDDADASHRSELYTQIANQYSRYMNNVLYNVGGIYLTEAKDGTAAKYFESVPRARQKAALAWILNQARTNSWLDDESVNSKLKLQMKYSPLVNNSIAQTLTKIYMNVTLSSYLAEKEPYTVKEYFDDLYAGVWDSAIKNKKLTDGDKILQKNILKMTSQAVGSIGGKKIGFADLVTFDNTYATSLDAMILYGLDEDGSLKEHYEELKVIENEKGSRYLADQLESTNFGSGYGVQNWVNSTAIDESATYYYDMMLKTKILLENRIYSAPVQDRVHYKAMLYSINNILGGK